MIPGQRDTAIDFALDRVDTPRPAALAAIAAAHALTAHDAAYLRLAAAAADAGVQLALQR